MLPSPRTVVRGAPADLAERCQTYVYCTGLKPGASTPLFPFSTWENAPMANLNKVMLIGRLTRDPEMRTFGNGGKVANFGFAVNNPKRNAQTGEWEDVPVWLDVEAFNRENGR